MLGVEVIAIVMVVIISASNMGDFIISYGVALKADRSAVESVSRAKAKHYEKNRQTSGSHINPIFV